MQAPEPLQVWFPLPHEVPAGLNWLGGQTGLEPVQVSAMSHGPTAPLQTVPAGMNASGGHAALVPVHISAMSHCPAAALHINELERKLATQVPFWQMLPASHTPAGA